MWKRIILTLALAATIGIFLILISPVNSRILKIALLGCVSAAWVGLAILGWPRRPLRIISLFLPSIILMVLILPSPAPDPEKLRQDYVRRLNSFEGTKYFWGGESYRGIDCSGLPRRAYRDALLAYGIINLNSHALRSYLEQWWFDASAQALNDGYRGYTVPLGVSGMIRKMDYSLLRPGDLAITANKIHVLAYAGNGRWIQADPALGEVATLDGRTATNGWFDTPVTMHRWFQLEEVKSSLTNRL